MSLFWLKLGALFPVVGKEKGFKFRNGFVVISVASFVRCESAISITMVLFSRPLITLLALFCFFAFRIADMLWLLM